MLPFGANGVSAAYHDTRRRLMPPGGMVGVLGSPSLDHQLQQAVMQVLALGMEQARPKVEAAAGGSGSGGEVWVDAGPDVPQGGLPQLGVYAMYLNAVQQLLQRHGGRLLAGGDPATAMQLVAMLRGMGAAHQQVWCGVAPYGSACSMHLASPHALPSARTRALCRPGCCWQGYAPTYLYVYVSESAHHDCHQRWALGLPMTVIGYWVGSAYWLQRTNGPLASAEASTCAPRLASPCVRAALRSLRGPAWPPVPMVRHG